MCQDRGRDIAEIIADVLLGESRKKAQQVETLCSFWRRVRLAW